MTAGVSWRRAILFVSILLTVGLVLVLQVMPAAAAEPPAADAHAQSQPADGSSPANQTDGSDLDALNWLSKSIVATNQPHTSGNNVTIGEIITYKVEVTVREGSWSNVTLVDTLDDGLAFVDCLAVSADAKLSTSLAGGWSAACNDGPDTNPTANPKISASGRTITFTLGTVTNSDGNLLTAEKVSFTYTAVVLNSSNNNRFDARNNRSVWSWTNSGGGSVSGSAPNVWIHEPVLYTLKAASNYLVSPGDLVTFTLFVDHALVLFDSDAFDVVLTDVIPAGLTFAGGLQSTGGLAPTSLSESGGVITARWDSFPTSAESTIQFTARVNGDVVDGQTIKNDSSLTWTSLPGNVISPQSAYNPLSTERTGNTADPGGEANDYRTDASTTILVSMPDLRISKSNDVEQVTPGTTIVYHLLIWNASLRVAPNVIVTETVPANTHFDAAASLTPWSCPDGAAAGTICTYTIGDLPILPIISLYFAVRVDNPVGPDAAAITNTVTVGDDGTHGPDADPTNNTAQHVDTLISAPDLAVVKTTTAHLAHPGELITFTLTYTNSGNQAAGGVILTETVPANTTFDAVASTAGWSWLSTRRAGWSCLPNGNAGSTCTFNVGVVPGGNASGSVIFAVRMANPLLPSDPPLSNTVTIGDNGSRGADPTPNDNTSSVSLPIVPTEFSKAAWVGAVSPT